MLDWKLVLYVAGMLIFCLLALRIQVLIAIVLELWYRSQLDTGISLWILLATIALGIAGATIAMRIV